jgi:cell division protein FtsB
VESVQYHELIPMLLNEVQRQQQKLETQSQELAELKAQNAALVERLGRLEATTTRTAAAATR